MALLYCGPVAIFFCCVNFFCVFSKETHSRDAVCPALMDKAKNLRPPFCTTQSYILVPDIKTAPHGIVTIGILNLYRVYLMSSVVNRIEDLGAEVWHIPGGCTSLCQPVNVGFNKPLKDCIHAEWEERMIEEVLESRKPPTSKQVTYWTVNAYNYISNKMLKDAWRHDEYSWFDD